MMMMMMMNQGNYKSKYGYIDDPDIYTKNYGIDNYGTRLV